VPVCIVLFLDVFGLSLECIFGEQRAVFVCQLFREEANVNVFNVPIDGVLHVNEVVLDESLLLLALLIKFD